MSIGVFHSDTASAAPSIARFSPTTTFLFNCRLLLRCSVLINNFLPPSEFVPVHRSILQQIVCLVVNVHAEYVTEPMFEITRRFPSPQFHHVQQQSSCIPPTEPRPLDAPRCPRNCISRPLFSRLAELGGSNKLIGLARLVMCLAEVPFFYMSGALINRIGTRSVAGLAQAAYAARFLYYSV